MKRILKLLLVVLVLTIADASMAQSRVNVQTLQPLPELKFKEVVVKFSEIPEIANFKVLLGVKNLTEVQGDNALMLEIMDELIDYNAQKLYQEGAITWSLPKEAVVLQHNPRLNSETVKAQFLQVVAQSYQTVKQLHEQGKTPSQIKEHLITTLK